jgi:hypothetical protein
MYNKLNAIKEHHSQIKYLDYEKMCMGMNQYRAAFYPFPNMDYAEAYYYSSSLNYFNNDYEDFLKRIVNPI